MTILCEKCRYSEGGFCHQFKLKMAMKKCQVFEYLTADNIIFPYDKNRAPIPHMGTAPPTRDMIEGGKVYEIMDEGVLENDIVYGEDDNSSGYCYARAGANTHTNAYYHFPIKPIKPKTRVCKNCKHKLKSRKCKLNNIITEERDGCNRFEWLEQAESLTEGDHPKGSQVQVIPGNDDITSSIPVARMPKRDAEPRPDTNFQTHDYSVMRRYGVEIPANVEPPFKVVPFENREQSGKKILITVPHAYGDEQDEDDNVALTGLKLYYELMRKGLEANIVFGNVPRSVVDLNRADSRATEFRKLIDDSFDNTTALIDLHTFPYGDAKYGKHDVALLQPMKYGGNWLGDRIYQNLKAQGVNVGSFGAFLRDDILMQAVKLNIPGVLIEINSETDTDLISKMLAEAIYNAIATSKEDITTAPDSGGALIAPVLPKDKKIRKAVEPSVQRYEEEGIENFMIETMPEDGEYNTKDPQARLKWQKNNPSATATQIKGDTTNEVGKR